MLGVMMKGWITYFLIPVIIIVSATFAYCEIYNKGYNAAVSDEMSKQADARSKAEKAIKPIEIKAAKVKQDVKIEYQTITKEVVKYVKSNNHNVCIYDADRVRTKQAAVDAANNIGGFNGGAVQSK